MSGSSDSSSPDWLREFKAPAQHLTILSSDSDSVPETSLRRPGHGGIGKLFEEEDSISIDSDEDGVGTKPERQKTPKKAKKQCLAAENLDAPDLEELENDVRGKPAGPSGSSRLPLVFPDKVQRLKALVECEGDSIDLSGDVGAVGRIVISEGPLRKKEVLLDLKGTIYKTTIVPSRTFCVVSVGQSEGKIEAIMNDFIQLEPQSNVFEAETTVEGTLEGFSFDSEDEGDKLPKSSHQGEQDDENKDQTAKKVGRKVDKSTGVAHKRSKAAGKASKKGPRKPQAIKRGRKPKK